MTSLQTRRRWLDAYDGLGDRYDLDKLTELLLGAITEAAEHVATSPRPGPTARSYATQLERLIGAITEPRG